MIPVKLLVTLLPFLALGVVAAPANKRSTPPKKCKAKTPAVTGGNHAGAGTNAPVPAPTGDSSIAPGPVPAPVPTGESGVSPAPVPAPNPADMSTYSAQPMPTGAGTASGAPAPAPTGLGKGDLKGVPEAPAGMKKATLGNEKRFVGYWSVNHGTSLEGEGPKWPEPSQLKGLTHVILDGKADFKSWQASWTTNWDTTAAPTLRGKKDGLKVMGAFGGWNQDAYFREQCATEAGRQSLADKMLAAVKTLDLDGIDLDWEFVGGNGEVYKDPGQENNPEERFWFIDLVYKLRVGLGPDKLLTSAVPGKEVDLALGFGKETVPALEKGIDFFNLMTYDLMNRRDNVTKHHSGGGAMLTTINHYKSRGMTPSMMTVGFPMYAKYFEAGKGAPCTVDNPVGCEFPEFTFENKMGKDTGKSGVYIMNEQFMTPLYLGNAFAAVEQKVKTSWATAQTNAKHDAEGMATSAWDADNGIYWTWLTDKDVEASCEAVMKEVGGVMVWSIDQDERAAAGGPRFDALQRCIGDV